MDFSDSYHFFDFEASSGLTPEFHEFLHDPENVNDSPLPEPVSTTNPNADGCSTALQETRESPSTPDVVSKPRQRRYAPRSRHGCLTCRARRKKCDAQKPVCRACIRVNAVCQWPEKLQISDYNRESELLEKSNAGTEGPPGVTSAPTRTVEVGANLIMTAHAPPTEVTLGNVHRALTPKPRYGRQLVQSQGPMERYLLTYYIHTVIPRMTIVHSPTNFFTSLYIPMALQHTAVLDAIIACSAAHLAKSVPGSEKIQELNSIVLQRQKLAHDFIQRPLYRPKLSDWEDSKLEIIVVLLLLIGLGAQGGDRSLRWMQQVNCVRELLRKHKASHVASWTSWETECIQKHFSYHDVMSLIMEDALDPVMQKDLAIRSGPFAHCSLTTSTPQAQVYFPRGINTSLSLGLLHHQTGSSGVDCLLGLSGDLFRIIARLRDLSDQDSNLGSATGNDFAQFEAEISNWRYDSEMASTLEVNSRLDLIALAECHRLAALILLYRRFPGRSFYLPDLASQIMSIVSRIGPASQAAPALRPILFLAGAELTSENDMALCAARLKAIGEAMKMNTTSAEEVLQAVWRDRLQKKSRTDWLEILRARRWTINLG